MRYLAAVKTVLKDQIKCPRRASGPHTRRRRAAIAVLDEVYRIAFRKRVYGTIDQLHSDLDVWMTEYNQAHPTMAAPRPASARPMKC